VRQTEPTPFKFNSNKIYKLRSILIIIKLFYIFKFANFLDEQVCIFSQFA